MRVGENLLGQRKVKSHEEGWPVYAMKSDYILAYHVTVCWPTSGVLLTWDLERIICLGEVIYQGVKPDIDGLSLVVRYWDTPAKSF